MFMFKEEACGDGSGHESGLARRAAFDVCSVFPDLAAAQSLAMLKDAPIKINYGKIF